MELRKKKSGVRKNKYWNVSWIPLESGPAGMPRPYIRATKLLDEKLCLSLDL